MPRSLAIGLKFRRVLKCHRSAICGCPAFNSPFDVYSLVVDHYEIFKKRCKCARYARMREISTFMQDIQLKLKCPLCGIALATSNVAFGHCPAVRSVPALDLKRPPAAQSNRGFWPGLDWTRWRFSVDYADSQETPR